jgi:hypothetical protein
LKRICLVTIDEATLTESAVDADVVLAWDRDADRLGAPQNVASLFSLIERGKPVWYRGGMETLHTAELIIGLGCEKVLVSTGFYKTERMPEHFIRRLGEGCVPVVRGPQEMETALTAGAKWLFCEYHPEPIPDGVNVIADVPGAWGAVHEL